MQNRLVEPQITIGITAYREGEWLRECWDSVLNQSSSAWEAILVLDGNADDDTRVIFDTIAHPRLRKVALEQNCGAYFARSFALSASQTPWYFQLDGDDRLPPNAIELIIQAFSRQPDAQFVIGDVIHFDENVETLHHVRVVDPELFAKMLPIPGQSPIRTELFRKAGGFLPDLVRGAGDWSFWLSVMEDPPEHAVVGDLIYERRLRDGSNSSKWRLRLHEISALQIEQHPQFFSSRERINRSLGYAHQIVAREYRALGQRDKAQFHAQEAKRFGEESRTLDEILREATMPIWRYQLRRLGRRMPIRIR